MFQPLPAASVLNGAFAAALITLATAPTADQKPADATRRALVEVEVPNVSYCFGGSLLLTRSIRAFGERAVLVVGDPGYAGCEGRVFVMDPSSGAVVRELAPPRGLHGYGISLALAGDFNGDGVTDLAVGSAPTARRGWGSGAVVAELRSRPAGVSVLSGATLESLAVIDGPTHLVFGTSLASLGDIDGDGCDELLVGSLGSKGHEGEATLFRGDSGVPIWTARVTGGALPWRSESYGRVVARLSDIDGDGVDECAIGAGTRNRVEVCSGRTGGLIYTITRADPGEWRWEFAGGLISLADVDGDGFRDLAISSMDPENGGGAIDELAVAIYSGKTGARIVDVLPPSIVDGGHRFGASIANLGDRDADGRDEFAVCAARSYEPSGLKAFVYTHASLARQRCAQASPLVEVTGLVSASGCDVDGDGVFDLATSGALLDYDQLEGIVQVISVGKGTTLLVARR